MSLIREAFSNLLSAKLRSILAIIGILVGTGSVVAMVSCGELATEAALAQFKALGTNLLSIALYDETMDPKAQINKKVFSVSDAENLIRASPDIALVAPYTTTFLPITYEGKSLSAGSIIGASEILQPAIKISMQQGRFISFLDFYTYYCVIGQGLYQQIKQQSLDDPLGKQLHLGTFIFTIVGVAQPWQENPFFNENINSTVIIPISTSQVLSKYAEIRNMVLRLEENANIDQVTGRINDYLSKVVPTKKAFIRSAQQIIQTMVNQREIYTVLLGLIGSISLLVGGIGVMNIMLMSVIERKREIGIRKAVGARKRDIQLLFLIEAMALTIFGGVLGVLCGEMTAITIAKFAGWPFKLFLLPPTIGFAVSAATGIFFGYYPAYKASLLDPIEALRTE